MAFSSDVVQRSVRSPRDEFDFDEWDTQPNATLKVIHHKRRAISTSATEANSREVASTKKSQSNGEHCFHFGSMPDGLRWEPIPLQCKVLSNNTTQNPTRTLASMPLAQENFDELFENNWGLLDGVKNSTLSETKADTKYAAGKPHKK